MNPEILIAIYEALRGLLIAVIILAAWNVALSVCVIALVFEYNESEEDVDPKNS